MKPHEPNKARVKKKGKTKGDKKQIKKRENTIKR
jgi:hypothetical protein